ncbi:hypothetical protein WDU94_010754 [Cyamophila willieti]
MLAAYTASDQKDWPYSLSSVLFAYNTSTNKSTKFSPFELVYGRQATLPLDIAISNADQETQDIRLTKIKEWREAASNNLQEAQQKMKQYFDKKRTNTKFKVGDKVILYVPARKVGRTDKLDPKYHGPLTVRTVLSDVNYEVEGKLSSKRHFKDIVHIERLKPFHEDKWDHRKMEALVQAFSTITINSVPPKTPRHQPSQSHNNNNQYNSSAQSKTKTWTSLHHNTPTQHHNTPVRTTTHRPSTTTHRPSTTTTHRPSTTTTHQPITKNQPPTKNLNQTAASGDIAIYQSPPRRQHTDRTPTPIQTSTPYSDSTSRETTNKPHVLRTRAIVHRERSPVRTEYPQKRSRQINTLDTSGIQLRTYKNIRDQ